jgi:serine/threonine-protein kinase
MSVSETSRAHQLIGGDRVGPYRIEDRLGSGGMGSVYRALGPDGEVVALKLVRPEMAANEQLRRRFKREAQAAARVDNKHVVPVLDSGEYEGTPYMAQQMINGGTLAERIDETGHLELERAVRVGLQVASGLDAMHSAGMIHRDLKPANILLDLDGCAYVADFGLVKEKDASVLTRPGQALGTLDYMSPEQIRAVDVTQAADIYSLGCVLYECIAGAPPFADRDGMRVMWAHLQDQPSDPCAGRGDLPESLGWAICQALEKEAEDRPPTPTAYARMVQVAAGVPPLSPEHRS